MPRMGLRAVVHVHSEWSHDGHDSLSAIAAFAHDERLRWVFLTDHAEDFDRDRFERYVQECAAHSTPEHQLVPGLEFRFDGFPGLHLLAIGLRDWISPDSPPAFCREARVHAQFLIMAHPLLTKYQAPDEVLAGLDGIEIWNARYNTRYLPDGRAIEFWRNAHAQWPHLVATGGTDQHRLAIEGRLRLRLPSSGDHFAALREGTFLNQGITMRVGSRPNWSPVQLAILARLRGLVERGKRWRNGMERRQARS